MQYISKTISHIFPLVKQLAVITLWTAFMSILILQLLVKIAPDVRTYIQRNMSDACQNAKIKNSIRPEVLNILRFRAIFRILLGAQVYLFFYVKL